MVCVFFVRKKAFAVVAAAVVVVAVAVAVVAALVKARMTKRLYKNSTRYRAGTSRAR